jgi:hypothetical protein
MGLIRVLLRSFDVHLGYGEAPHDLRSRLLQISGVFCRSRDEDALLVFCMAFLVAVGAAGAFGLVRSAWRYGYSMDVWLPIVFLLALFAAVWGPIWWRFNTKYHIENGRITALTRGGKERWSESIAAIQTVLIVKAGPWRSDRWLYLKWPGYSRRIELFDTLAAELHV